MSQQHATATVVIVNLLLIVAGLIAVELMFGSWFSATHALHTFTKPRNVALVQANPFGSEPKEIRYTRDSNGFRGLQGALDKIDIITVGGSTTDQRFLDDDATYQAVLSALFKQSGRSVSIVNAGIDGQSTIGHIHNFDSWFRKIETLRTRYILYYIGINDVLRLEKDAVADGVEGSTLRLRWQLYIREKSIFYQLYVLAKRAMEPNPFAHGATFDFVVEPTTATDKGNVSDYSTTAMATGLTGLRERVAELDRLTRQFGARSIFVTQRSARWTVIDGKLVGIPAYLQDDSNEFKALGNVTGVDIYHVERQVADAIMETCRDVDAICLDFMSGAKFTFRSDFYDCIHTTASGSRVIAEFLYRELKNKI